MTTDGKRPHMTAGTATAERKRPPEAGRPPMADILSQTVAVTVFPDRARVTRRGRTTLTPGAHLVAFRDLPPVLLPESARAAGRGVARVKLLGVHLKREYFVETPEEAVNKLERRIEEVEDKDADFAVWVAALESEKANLAAIGEQAEMFARGLALRGKTAEETTGMLAALGNRIKRLEIEKLEIGRERRGLARELDKLRRELNALKNARTKERWSAEIELECTQGGEFEIDLTYLVTNAGWKPLYDLRLGETALEVTYLAEVSQTTGEDWAGVSLTLSTTSPSLSLAIPELDPWYIEPYAPPRVALAKRAALPAAAMAMAAPSPAEATAGAVPEPPPPAEAEVAYAEVSSSGAAVTYRVGGSADIPGDGTPRKTAVASFNLQPKLDYVTAPKLEDSVYRRATVKNDSPYLLLPGSAQLFEGEEYLGASSIELTSPGQEIELVLGVDDRMRVKRELKLREVDKKMIGDRRRLRYGYEIEVENLRDADQTILVRDHIPLSRHEDIKVRLEISDPRLSEQSDLNLLEWKMVLAKGKKQTVRYEYSVEYPRSMEVRGLE